MGCPKCGVDNFEFPGPCLQCGFQGEAKLFQEWLNLNFLLKELAGWGHLPEFYRGRLRDRYGRQRRDVEIRLGLRQAPLDTEAAEAARRELSGLRAFTISDLTRWVERGWLTPDVAGRLREDCNNRITALQERLVDAPPPPPKPSSFDQARFVQLHYQLRMVDVLHKSDRLAQERVFEEARAALTAELHQVEIRLGLRQPPRKEPLAEKAASIAVPEATGQRPPPDKPAPPKATLQPPPRKPLTWDRVWETLLSERTLRAILFLGATLLFAAAVSLVIWNWGTFPPWLQVTFLASFTAAFYGLGWYVRNKMKLIVSGIALSAVASLLVPLDFYAFYLSGGFLGLSWSDVWLLTSVVCLAAYLLTVYLIQAEFFGYLVGVAAGSLLAAILQFGGNGEAWWVAALAGLGLILSLVAMMLSAVQLKGLRKWRVVIRPFWHLAAGGVTAVLTLATSWSLIGLTDGTHFLTSLAIAWWFGGPVYLLAVTRFQMQLVAVAAAISFPVAVLLSQRQLYAAWGLTAAWYALGWAILTPFYLIAGHNLQVKKEELRLRGKALASSEQMSAYGRIALISCLLLILASFGWALGDSGAIGLVHLILALTLIGAARLWKRPNLLFFTSLFLMSSMAGLVSTFGGTIGYLGVGWALLGIGHIVVALRLANHSPPSPYAVPMFRGGWMIGALALVPPVFTQERPILTYALGNWIGLNGWLALLVHEERLKLDSFWPTVRGRLLRLPSLTFHWVAAMLLPLWLWLAWHNGRPTSTLMGLAFLGLACLVLGLGRWLRGLRWAYGRAWFTAAQLSALIGLFVSPAEFDQPLAAALFLGAALFYGFSARILHNRWWLVMAGLTLPIGLVIGLDWLNVPMDSLIFSLSVVVLVYIAGPLLANRYGSVSGRYQRPLKDVAYFIGAAVFLLSVSRLLLSNRADSILLWMAATHAVLAVAVGIYAWSENEEGFGHIAAWLGVLSGGLVAGAFSQGRGSSAAKAALIAVVYILGERLLRQAALKRGWQWRTLAGRGWRLFRRPILQAGWGVSIIAVLLALLRNMLLLGGGTTRETWAIIALLLITGLYLVSSWLFRRYPGLSGWRVWWAAVLIFFPWTLLTHRGWYLGFEPQNYSVYAASWALLALVQLGIATFLASRAVDRRWIRPPQVVAHLLMPFALVWGTGNAATSSVSFGMGVIFYLLAVYLDRLLWQKARRSGKGSAAAVPSSLFLFAAAFLYPAWTAYLLKNFSPEATEISFGLLMLGLSLPFWLLGRWVVRREPAYRMPLNLTAYLTAVIGTFLVSQNQPILIGALLFDALLGALSARYFKRPIWLYVTTITFATAWALTLDEWHLPIDRFGWGLVGLSQLYLVIAWGLSKWKQTTGEKPDQKVSSMGMPFLIGAFCILALSIPLSTLDRLAVQIGYSTAALMLVQAAVWLRQPVMSALAAGLLVIPYWLTMTDLGLGYEDRGLAMWPFIIIYLLLGFGLDKFVGIQQPTTPGHDLRVLKPFPWYSPIKWFEAGLNRLLYWWGFPFYGLAFSLAGLAVLLSRGESRQLTIVLLLTAVIFGWATAYFRLRGWLLVTIGAGQMAIVSGMSWLDWWDQTDELGLLFLPVTIITAVIGLFVERREQEGPLLQPGGRISWQGWSRPFFAMLALNLLIGQMIALNFGNLHHSDLPDIWITAVHILLIIGLAGWWASDLLATVPVLMGLILLVQLLFYNEAEATTWPTALALLAFGYGLSGYFLRFLRNIGAGWVRQTAVQIWEWPLLVGGWLVSILSWLTVLLAGLRVLTLTIRVVFRLTLLTPSDVAQVQMVVAVLAILGLFYLAAAVVERHTRLGYIAVAMMLLAWSLEWGLVWNQREVQWYAIPAGIYLLLVGYLEWRHGSRGLARWIDRLALLLLLGTSFWQSLGPNGWPYALLMGFEGLMITWWGSTRRLRRFLYAGVIGVTIDVTWQLIDPLLTATNRWIVFGIVGVFLVSLAIIVERRLEKVMALTKDVRRRLENWE